MLSGCQEKKKRTLLIAEPSLSLRKKLKYFLEQEGFRVLEADSGAKVLEILENEVVDILLCETHLPWVDGIGLLKYVRKYRKCIAVILMTALPDLHTAIQALRYRAWDYLVKPFSLSLLKKRIREILEEQPLCSNQESQSLNQKSSSP